MARDYYSVLGVKKDASGDDIKRAYRELALKYHPDRNANRPTEEKKKVEEKFKEINEAYAVLGDPEKRKQYDAYGPDVFNQRFTQEDIFRDFNIDDVFKSMGINFGFGSGPEGMFDIFGFGGAGGRQGRAADVGNDILERTSITLKEAAQGTDKRLVVGHIKECEACGGTGAEGRKTVKCDRCDGAGQVRATRRTPFGIIQTITTCPKCSGGGKTFEKVCKSCGGHGRKNAQNKIEVKIQKGIQDGMRLRLRGMGDYGVDHTGDLYVEVQVLPDKTFTRDGDDLSTNLHVPFYIAMLGGTVEAPTIDGTTSVGLEPGTQQGSVINLKGKGMPWTNGNGYGNEILNIVVDVPRQLNKEERELLEKFRELDGGGGKKSDKKKFGFI